MTEQPASEHPDGTVDDVVGGDSDDAPAGPGDAGRTTVGDALRWLAVAACAGAAVIHFAYAPTHIEEDATHGTFFLVTAWLQLGLAFALARWRTDRRPWLAAGAVNGAVAAMWVLTRTAGLPGEDPEPVGFPDTLATALEVVVVLAAVAALRPTWARRPSFRLHPVVGGVAAVALAAVVSASVTPSIAGEHQHGEDGGHAHAVEGRRPRSTPTTGATSASTPRRSTTSASRACPMPTTTAPRSTSRSRSGPTCSSTRRTASRPTWSPLTSRTARSCATASSRAA